ncbi:alpha-amylase family glycosyl hydrolase [Neobacillus citreus]|uniref:Alpha-amylase family glycosyl hydrolase n=1 Tax=Neobacillus citreus TaxID=2833578 RepID=A0A942YDW7_9BACI|nr:alpha-amylase family glycosyl hydrolase [Neobacillus citreus]MCH6266952.1 alpha-amylase family glycosyl hydrolase [Neobacillus citreus]
MKGKSRKWMNYLALLALVVQTIAGTAFFHPAQTNAEGRIVTLVGDLQDELGGSGEWNPADPATQMKLQETGKYILTGKLPAGNYEYKIAINGTWDENYGADGARNGDNYKLSLDKETEVTFVYDDTTHRVTVPIELPDNQKPRIVGDIQPELNAGGEWSPSESTAILHDEDHDNVYTYTAQVPKGKHEFKIVLGDNWSAPAYPANNFVLNVLKDVSVTFFYNHDTKEVYTNYDPGLPDGNVQGDKLYHDTWDTAYRSPFGAVKAGDGVKLRLQAKKGDLTGARVQLKNYNTGNTVTVDMESAGWLEQKGGQVEFWEANVTPKEKGVYGYKFIAQDGAGQKEYGEDVQEGGIGTASDSNASLFQLTVYDPSYKTPDWMKEAVVYQIFPDRFYNGNKKNDNAKNNARGEEQIEHKEWTDLPDNPRLKGTEGYQDDAIFSNDFFGGDIAGIQQKLDYIQSLGVNTLYLNPIAEAASNHKYDAADYKNVDPMFGSPQEFEAFTKELKKRKMHLILDGVFNHVGDDSIYFDRYGKYPTVGAYEYWSSIYDLVNQGISEDEAKKQVKEKFISEGQTFSPYGFENWFNIQNEKVDGVYKYQCWWGYDSLPEIKSIPGEAVDYPSELNNDSFANYIMYDEDSVAKSWIKKGSSGWRLDVANEVDPQFWREFRKELKTGKKDEPLILGEIWDDASKYFLGDLYDSVMNYRFRGAMIDYLKTGNAEGAQNQLNAVYEDYPKEAFYSLMNLMGSHDTARAAFVLGNGTDSFERAEFDKNYNQKLGIQRLKLAAILQMGYAGAPTIYYGDEAGVTGSKDPDDRRTYPWGSEDQELIKHYQAIGKVRSSYHDLFSYGDLHHLYAKGDVLAFSRSDKKNVGIVITNRSNEQKTVELNMEEIMINGIKLTDQLDKRYTAESKDGKLIVTIPAMSGRMLVSEKGQNLKRPAAVTDLTVEEGNHSGVIKWEGDAQRYAVYQTTISGAFYKKVKESSTNSVTIDGLDNGRKYYFAVAALDKNGNSSEKVEFQTAVIPHVKLTEDNYKIENVTSLEQASIDLSKPETVTANFFVKGETETGEMEGLQAKLEVKKPGSENWISYNATYVNQQDVSNVFSSNFLAFDEGSYEYRFAFSNDLGRTWVTSEIKTVTFTKGSDTIPPVEKITLAEPQQESGQVNLSWKLEGNEDPYMIVIVRDGIKIDQLLDVKKESYRDINVTNGKTNTYEVQVYDRAGNMVKSNPVTVTPELVTVKVTFKVNAPAYTPQGIYITMPGSKNGWNTGAWQMTRAGAVTNDYEYTVEAQEGEVLTYKYVKNGTWDQEGLPDHTASNPDDDDVSYYGYGAQGTDLSIIVTNQGGNQMVVQDKIVRWIDQPVVITSHTDGQTVSSDTITLQGYAIKDGVLTINGEPVTINSDMTFSQTIKLNAGENKLSIHIEPSESSKTTNFKNDGGAIAKATKTFEFVINKQ